MSDRDLIVSVSEHITEATRRVERKVDFLIGLFIVAASYAFFAHIIQQYGWVFAVMLTVGMLWIVAILAPPRS
jgi:hypothetical protein